MNANEMKYNLLIKYDKISSLLAPGYDDREISYLLNNAQDRVFFHIYNPLGNKYQQGFEYNEKRRRDLVELTSSINIIGSAPGTPRTGVLSGTVAYTTTAFTKKVAGDTNYKVIPITAINPVEVTGAGITLTKTRGLSRGMTIIYTGGATDTIVEILSDSSILVATGKASSTAINFTAGAGLSANQTGGHANGFGSGLNVQSKGFIFDLPPLFLYATEENCITEEELGTYIPIKPITHDYYIANIRNPYKAPYKNLVWRMDVGKSEKGSGLQDNSLATNYSSSPKRVELVTNGNKIVDYFISYLRYPRRIVCDEATPGNQVSCELDDSIHDMILDEAAKIASGITNPETYQVKQNEANTSE